MKRIDFYLLTNSPPEGKLRLAARLTSKVYHLGERVYISAQDRKQAETLDNLLWTFDQSSFIPHEIQDQTGTAQSTLPIVIGCEPPCEFHDNVLISLLDDVPDYFAQFERIAEVVDNNTEDKDRARRRFRHYRDLGCQIETHEISL